MTVLILRALGIGDLCAATPALRALRRAYARDRLVLAAPGWLAPLAALTGALDDLTELGSLDDPIPRAERRPRLAVNLHGKGPQSHRLLLATEPGDLLAYRCPTANWDDGPDHRDAEHEVRRWCRLLSWAGLAVDPTDLTLLPPLVAAPVDAATIVHPGAKDPGRRWAPERFATVARALADHGHDVVVTGEAADAPAATRIAEHSGARVLAGRTRVDDLAALVAGARLVICGDTGLAHLATAYGTPSVVLFAHMDPALWGPPESDRHQVIRHPEAADPLAAITPREVLAAVDRALAA
ncbi:MAG: glycosyltransferase family 9 protein [Hamadaea sp.]|nr:glycosyltransferase family 9 protein [Hamadaea sp.]